MGIDKKIKDTVRFLGTVEGVCLTVAVSASLYGLGGIAKMEIDDYLKERQYRQVFLPAEMNPLYDDKGFECQRVIPELGSLSYEITQEADTRYNYEIIRERLFLFRNFDDYSAFYDYNNDGLVEAFSTPDSFFIRYPDNICYIDLKKVECSEIEPLLNQASEQYQSLKSTLNIQQLLDDASQLDNGSQGISVTPTPLPEEYYIPDGAFREL
jgi:hypothetical protein